MSISSQGTELEEVVRLVPRDPDVPTVEIHLDRLPVRIGRCPDAEVSIPDRWLSRWHCEFTRAADGALLVRDLDSKHGTYVNGQPVRETRLMSGDELSVGLCRFVTRMPVADDATSP